MILRNLRDYLLGFTSVTNRIGDRIHANRLPGSYQGPYVLISRVSGDTPYNLAGEIGTTQTLIQVACWAGGEDGSYEAYAASESIRNVLSGFRGTWDGVLVSSCVLTSEPIELADDPPDGSRYWLHGVTSDYRVTHSQAVPTLS